MSNSFDKIILITDADGTLLTDDKRILDIDRAAIAEFIENGGLFTIATGRGVSLSRVVARELGISEPGRGNGLELMNLPAVIFNGAAVYDYKSEKFLWKCALCEEGMAYIRMLMEKFPDIGVEILIDDKIYVVRTNRHEETHLELGVMNPVRCDLSQVPSDGWIKTLLIDEPEVIDEVIEFSKSSSDSIPVHMVRSAPMYYEVLPKGINKGYGAEKLLDIMRLEGYYIVAAGDYMNDLEMVRAADLSFAVANAEEVVKQAADFVLCDNNSGIIHEIVNYLKSRK
jgi:Cof subfamily protein (haloacid dehalogenase superfamily)